MPHELDLAPLVLPHLMWDGGTATPVRFSRVFSLAPLRALLPEVVEMADFVELRLAPRRLVLLRGDVEEELPERRHRSAPDAFVLIPQALRQHDHDPRRRELVRDVRRVPE